MDTLFERGWEKAMIALGIAILMEIAERFCRAFSADAALLLILVSMTLLGTALHFLALARGHDFSARAVLDGVFRLPLYCLYLFLVGSIGVSVEHSIQIGLPVLNLFISYLVAGEVIGIIANLKKLGVKVPVLLLYMASSVKSRIEAKFPAGKGADTENGAGAAEPHGAEQRREGQ